MPAIRYILTILLSTLLVFHTDAQQLYFKNISNSLQIPSPECYNVIQDSKGYIWFGTEAGLCRFDGSSVKIFDKKNGLPEASIYAMTEDKHGTVWFASSKNKILKYQNDSLKEVKIGQSFEDFISSKYVIADKLNITSENEAYLNYNFGTYKIDLNTGKGELITHHPIIATYIFEKKGDAIIRIVPASLKKIIGPVKAVVIDNKDTTEILIEKNKNISTHWRSAFSTVGDEHFINIEGTLFKIDKNKQVSRYYHPGRILSIYPDKYKGLWVGTYKHGVYYYPNIQTMSAPIHSLTDCSVTGIVMDREDNIWCTSLEKGILFCNNKDIITYTNIDGLDESIDLLKNEAGRLFISSGISQLFEINGEGLKKHNLNIQISSTIFDIVKNGEEWIIAGSLMIGSTSDFDGINYIRDSAENSTMIYEVERANDIIYGLSYQHIARVYGKRFFLRKMPFLSPAKYLIHSHDEVFYVGTNSGLFLVNFFDNSYIPIKEGVPVSKLMKSRTGNVWFTTKGKGVFIIKNQTAYNISSLLKIPTDYYYDITEDKYNNIWLASNVGLIKLEPRDVGYRFTVIDAQRGLPTNIINRIAANEKSIFFASSDGLFSLPLWQKFTNTTHPEIYINSIHINGKLINKYQNNIILPYDENSLRIKFDAITYKNLDRRELLYKMKGRDTAFQKNKGTEIVLDNLPPGKYELEVFAINNDEVLSKESATFNFEIKKPFWQTWLFIITCVIIFITAIFLIIRKIIYDIKRKEEEKTRINKLMAEYQLSAIQAQMNPHFIFNAINSIQSYILQQNEQQAYDYLAKFSKLIRMVLNNSEEKILTLAQELQTLELYIQLEKLRFDDNFEYILNISDNVNPHEVFIPAMMIQPYVENAIWHGLMNMDDKKRVLCICVSTQNEKLFISIEDNGVGREIASHFKKNSDHKSIGMKLNQKRLTMINQLKDFEDASITIVDLFDESGKASGTRIEIYIPIN